MLVLFIYKLFYLFFFIIPVTISFKGKNQLHPHHVDLENSGPALLDYPITFSACLIPPCPEGAQCTFNFFDEALHQAHNLEGTDCVSFVNTYKKISVNPGKYNMSLEVKHHGKILASNSTIFELTELIPGHIEYVQPDLPAIAKPFYVLRNSPIFFTLHINGLANQSLHYTWEIEGKKLLKDQSFINYTFTDSGKKEIRATALFYKFPSIIYGFYELYLTALDPVLSINSQGLTNLQHGKMLNLVITCVAGGDVFEYCWRAISANNVSGERFDCDGATVTSTCEFQVIYYLGTPGSYLIQLYIHNFVDIKYKNITVKILDVENQVGLYEVILPVMAVLLALIIVSCSLILYQRTRPQHNIEVADFDFQGTPEGIDTTFFERLNLNCKNYFCRCTRRPSLEQEDLESAEEETVSEATPITTVRSKSEYYDASVT